MPLLISSALAAADTQRIRALSPDARRKAAAGYEKDSSTAHHGHIDPSALRYQVLLLRLPPKPDDAGPATRSAERPERAAERTRAHAEVDETTPHSLQDIHLVAGGNFIDTAHVYGAAGCGGDCAAKPALAGGAP